jgi:4-hydroxythreonine-4-phosphate dehydrogenase
MSNPPTHRDAWVGISIGDPTGIGPEVVVGSIASGIPQKECIPIAIGNSGILKRAAQLRGLDLRIVPVSTLRDAKDISTAIDFRLAHSLLCLETGDPNLEQVVAPNLRPGVDARAGQAAYECVVRGTELCLEGELQALVTGPLHKVALHGAGHDWPGHTELISHLCGVRESAMMLYLTPGKINHGGSAGLGVVHVTLHCALRDVFDRLTVDSVFQTIALAHDFFFHLRRCMNLPPEPRIAVAALNPHAGESGRFGNEELTVIGPSVSRAVQKGWNVEGPLPTDTLMPAAARGDYDAVVAMYHDQGHIALKLIDMFEAVNITLGLPIVRTSVAHGTAHDIAWKGLANSGGMTQAILTAARMAKNPLRNSVD